MVGFCYDIYSFDDIFCLNENFIECYGFVNIVNVDGIDFF